MEKFKQSRKSAANYKNVVTYSNKLLGFKIDPKSGEKITIAALGKPGIFLHELTTKNIKVLIAERKLESASNWTIKQELQALRGTI